MAHKLVSLHHANDGIHKFIVKLVDSSNQLHTIKFGAKGYSDYTINKDSERKERYIARHKKKEDWTSKGVLTAGFWSRWLLWNKPTLQASLNNVIEMFHL